MAGAGAPAPSGRLSLGRTDRSVHRPGVDRLPGVHQLVVTLRQFMQRLFAVTAGAFLLGQEIALPGGAVAARGAPALDDAQGAVAFGGGDTPRVQALGPDRQ